MEDEKKTSNYPTSATYQMGNREFIVRRSFSEKRTIAEILTTEITSGTLQQTALSSNGTYGIMQA